MWLLLFTLLALCSHKTSIITFCADAYIIISPVYINVFLLQNLVYVNMLMLVGLFLCVNIIHAL